MDGKIIAAAQEERFTRKKHDERFPTNAVEYCLREGGITIKDVDIVAFYDKPFLKFERLLETYLDYAPRGIRSFLKAMGVWLKEKLWMPEIIRQKLGYTGKLLFMEHHQSHAASAFFASPFQEAAILTVDGVGEWATTSWSIGKGNTMTFREEIDFPHSLGLLYSAFTYYTGFKVNSGEYKVMGLAPYGEPKYADLIRSHLLEVRKDGSFRMNMEYFDFPAGLTMTNNKFHDLFGGPPREPESPMTQREMDLAASVQVVTEEIMLAMAAHIQEKSGMKYLCLAGGVALNCVANGRILREGPFEDVWIQPAAGDAGGALGAALAAWYQYLGNPRRADGVHDAMRGSYLGPEFSDEEIASFLQMTNAVFIKSPDAQLFDVVASAMTKGDVVGWFQGRMEFGPRALGGRSIVGDPRNPEMQSKMNLKIKFRESFRPFAPSVKEERVSEYFELDQPSPYMLLVADVVGSHRKTMSAEDHAKFGIEKLNVLRSDIPAVTHIDYSARIQTVSRTTAPRYWALIDAFERQSGCAVIVNTSFNVRGEPIVCSPADAFRCFMRTDMDMLVLGNYILRKKDQTPIVDDESWKEEFTLD